MYKSVLFVLTVSMLSSMSWVESGYYKKIFFVADTIKKDTTLRLITNFEQAVKDTTKKNNNIPSNEGLQRDTTYRPDTTAKIKTATEVIKTSLMLADISHLSVCPRSLVSIPFKTSGIFNTNNVYKIQMSDATGKFSTIADSIKTTPATIQIPADRSGTVWIKLISTNPYVESKPVKINVLALPRAHIELSDGSFMTKVGPGQVASYRVNLTGSAPWSFSLSDSTTIANTFSNPYIAQVTANETTSIKVNDVANACGSGTTSGEVIVQVSQDTLPVIALKLVPRGGYRVCTGTPFQINFNATGKYYTGNGFVVQLSDSTGQNFKNISDLVSESPVMVKTPTLKTGWYKMRIVSTFPNATSDTADVRIASTASAILRKDTLSIAEGGNTNLTVDFKGDGPWFYLLSDGSYQTDIKSTPHLIKVNPINPTAYSITSAGGYCGVGDFSGNAFVKVKIPPTTISTGDLSKMVICANTEVAVSYKTTGRFSNTNQFVVQIKDTSGTWINLPTTRNAEVLKAKIVPPVLTDTLSTQQIRVISTVPYVEGNPTTIKVYMANAAQARISGGGIIRPGGATRLRINFKNGLPPWSFKLSDGTNITGTFINPYQMTVSPRASTDYSIISVTNTCGSGVAIGTAQVKLETN